MSNNAYADLIPAIAIFPQPIPHFLGRDRELQAIDRLIGQGINVIEIADPPNKLGMGKSALAIQAVHRQQSHYSDFQLYTNLYGQDAFPAHARDVLQEWLVLKFGLHPRSLPQRFSELQALYQEQIAGKKVIVVLDNVANLKQIQPLLTPNATHDTQHYVVLITSRNPILTAEYGKTLFVDRLNAASSLALLTGEVPPVIATAELAAESDMTEESPTNKALQQIIKQAEGSPFVLNLLGQLLQGVTAPAPDTVMLEIEKGKRNYQASYPESLAQLMACLNVAYQAQSMENRDLLSRLSVLHGAQFNAPLAAHLCGELDSDAIERRLVTLHRSGWLTPMPNLVHVGQSQEYMMPEVARAFLWKKVQPKARHTLASWALGWHDQDRNVFDRQMLEVEAV
jgi:NB-ARC domain